MKKHSKPYTSLTVWIAVLTSLLIIASVQAAPLTVYVSPDGNDNFTGTLAEINAEQTDGPLASVQAALGKIRAYKAANPWEGAQIQVRGGIYYMSEPLTLTPEDNGQAITPLVISAYPGETPILSGGVPITGWQDAGNGVWQAKVPGVAERQWSFRQLFINGRRATRAVTPDDGKFEIVSKGLPQRDPVTGQETAHDNDAFIFKPGEVKNWDDLTDIEIVIYHSWETSRHRIARVDEAAQTVYLTGRAVWPFDYFGQSRRYYIENAPDSLDTPGEWQLNRNTGIVSYIPLPGEDMTTAEVVASRLKRLVELNGDSNIGLPLENVVFRDLTFSHQDWELEPEGHSDPQAVWSIGAAILADGISNCSFEDCEISHVGEYAIWLRHGCKYNKIIRNRIHDFGTGGIRLGFINMAANESLTSSHNLVDNNHVYDGGHVYRGGVGIFLAQTHHNIVSHNEVHDHTYSGMSIGWNWGDEANRTSHNVMEYNHVHHTSNGEMSDTGSIYTLGTSPGSIIRGNVLHDSFPYKSPDIAWGIYLDATTNGYLVEDNLVYNTYSGSLMMANGGHNNIIQNNIFANTATYAIWPYFPTDINKLERNIIYYTQGSLLAEHGGASLKARQNEGQEEYGWDHNLYYATDGKAPKFMGSTFDVWQEKGLDQNSIFADPLFRNPVNNDFTLPENSPALTLGFKPFDTSKAGLYGNAAWVKEAKDMLAQHPPTVLPVPPPPPGPQSIQDDFETTVVGATPQNVTVSGEKLGASIRISDEQAASGIHSIRVQDKPGIDPSYEPHFFYQPHQTTGKLHVSYKVMLQPGCNFFVEWRDNTAYPENIGPTMVFSDTGAVNVPGVTEPLVLLPFGQWAQVEVECELNPDAPVTSYTATITPPGQEPMVFENLPILSSDFHAVHWLGFVSTSIVDSKYFVDDVIIGDTVAF